MEKKHFGFTRKQEKNVNVLRRIQTWCGKFPATEWEKNDFRYIGVFLVFGWVFRIFNVCIWLIWLLLLLPVCYSMVFPLPFLVSSFAKRAAIFNKIDFLRFCHRQRHTYCQQNHNFSNLFRTIDGWNLLQSIANERYSPKHINVFNIFHTILAKMPDSFLVFKKILYSTHRFVQCVLHYFVSLSRFAMLCVVITYFSLFLSFGASPLFIHTTGERDERTKIDTKST